MTKALFSSGNISDKIPVPIGLTLASLKTKKNYNFLSLHLPRNHFNFLNQFSNPAAKTILNMTKCQNSVTAPIKNMAMANIIVQMVNIRILFHLSATIPKKTPTTVKTAIKDGPAKI